MSSVALVSLPAGAARSYEIAVGAGTATTTIGRVTELVPGVRRALLVLDTGVPAAFVRDARAAVEAAGVETRSIEMTPSEGEKSLAWVERMLVAMAGGGEGEHGPAMTRKDAVVAIGGGVVGDVAGYAAASYQRGVAVIQCPTTLLAMVDSSVGGKTGVNLRVGGGAGIGGGLLKNYAGAFHQPAAVAADVSVLSSLDPRVLACGAAECVKHGFLSGAFGDGGLLGWTVERAGALMGGDAGALTELVTRNVRVKAAVVASDERELAQDGAGAAGGRALLNLGHTFAHAIETIPGVRGISADGGAGPEGLMHGEAVSIGVVAAHAAARSLGLVGDAEVGRARGAMAAFGLPVAATGLPGDGDLVARMLRDKKAVTGALRLVLPDASLGDAVCRVVDGVNPAAAEAGWAAVRAG